MKTKSPYYTELVETLLLTLILCIFLSSCSKESVQPSAGLSGMAASIAEPKPQVVHHQSAPVPAPEQRLGVSPAGYNQPVIIFQMYSPGENIPLEYVVYNDGQVVYPGGSKNDDKDIHYLTIFQFNSLNEAFVRFDFAKMQAEYPGSMDLPTSTITQISYKEDISYNKTTVVEHGIDVPENLANLKASIMKILNISEVCLYDRP